MGRGLQQTLSGESNNPFSHDSEADLFGRGQLRQVQAVAGGDLTVQNCLTKFRVHVLGERSPLTLTHSAEGTPLLAEKSARCR